MKINETEVVKGLPVEVRDDLGEGKYLPGLVVDTNEFVKAVKVEVRSGPTSVRRNWYALSQVKLRFQPQPLK